MRQVRGRFQPSFSQMRVALVHASDRIPLMKVHRWNGLTCWLLAFLAVVVWAHFDSPGWDIEVYTRAIHSIRAGHDPYVDAMAMQESFHKEAAKHINDAPPNGYVYPPMTLDVLKLAGLLPSRVALWCYWSLIALSVMGGTWVGMQAARPCERPSFSYVAIALVFFPAFVQNDTILSGNIAFLLYGAVLSAAMLGWKRGNWLWCYVAIVGASCVKVPMLSLLALPVLSARRQWVGAAIAGGAGVALFVMQPLIWSELFRHYLQAVNMQLEYNLDFGASPAGVLSKLLMQSGQPYRLASVLFYIVYAACVLALLLVFSRRFLGGKLEFDQWMPVTLIGVLLLNPRIIEYDFVPVTIPMALVAWRFFTIRIGRVYGPIFLLTAVLAANVIGATSYVRWKPTAGFLLVACFCMGCWHLWHQTAGLSTAELADSR